MQFKGIILDFNGTLVWDTPFHKEAWIQYATELGHPIGEREYYEFIHGQTNLNILKALLNRDIDAEEAHHHGQEKERCYRERCLASPERFKLAAGVEEFLDFLKEREIPRTIATASEGVNVAFFIEYFKLHRWFDTDKIVFDDGHIKNKPDPEIYLIAAEKLTFAPEEIVVVEDSIHGVHAARAAGMGRIILAGPEKDRGEKLKNTRGIHRIINHFDEIPRDLWC